MRGTAMKLSERREWLLSIPLVILLAALFVFVRL
jgi:hypothetical protein